MRLLIASLALLTASFGLFAQEEQLQMMPEWQLYNEAGELVKSSDYKGKPVILHFWATWCPYCKKLQPGLDRVYRKYKDQGLEMIAISIREDDGATPQATLDDRNMSFKTLILGDEIAFDKFNVRGTPTTVFVDAKGQIVGVTGTSDPEDPNLEIAAKFLVESIAD
ncbi:TlpA family protein disulfide reductase [Alteromonadaceae bacterium M269]|nr:TlpA family protein disulfide reductase [Alteromonadaceae bacterium M269]